MGDHIVGMKKMKEISATVKGANEHSTKVFQKSFGGKTQKTKTGDPAPTTPTESDMDKVLMKSMLALDEAGRSYAAGLDDDACEAFLRKSRDEQVAEVTKHAEAEKAKADAAAEDEKKKAAGDPEVVALRAEVETLKSAATAEKAKARDNELREVAKTKYAGVPKAYDILKSVEGLSDEAKAPILANLDSQQAIAKSLGTTFGDDDAGEGTAKAKFDAKVEEHAKEKSISKSLAYTEVSADPANAQLVREMRAEMAG